jgi:hypothetical protein
MFESSELPVTRAVYVTAADAHTHCVPWMSVDGRVGVVIKIRCTDTAADVSLPHICN